MIANSTIENHFPFCMQQGADSSFIDKQRIREFAAQHLPVTQKQINNAVKEHLVFLQNGGAGGQWKTIHIKGIVLALYFGKEIPFGKQANFELQRFTEEITLEKRILPFSNFCGSIIEKVNFKNSDLSYSMLTDVTGQSANFENAQLAYTDFTRANLENANFQNANLIGADFENCHLSGADFRGANLSQARFPGAILKKVRI